LAILVIGNDNESAELIYEILMNEPNNIIFAEDGVQGLIAFRKYELSTIIVDLDICFISILEFIKIIKEESKKIKIVLFGTKNDEILEKLKSLGVEDFVEKDNLLQNLLLVYKSI
jgi:CheY-like chemotaxis protein